MQEATRTRTNGDSLATTEIVLSAHSCLNGTVILSFIVMGVCIAIGSSLLI